MIVDIPDMEEVAIEHFNGGYGTVYARMYNDGVNRVLISRIPTDASIGMHTHQTNQETMFILEGEGTVICDGVEEKVSKGYVHICPKGSSHSIMNNGTSDLILFGSVVQL